MSSNQPDRDRETSGSSGSRRPPLDSKAPVYLLAILLVLVLVFANVAFAADRTALDSDHAVETMENEDVFEDITEQVREEVTDDINESIANEAENNEFFGSDDFTRDDAEELAEDAVTEDYIEEEATDIIEDVYDYINGNTDNVDLVIDLDEPRENVVESLNENPDVPPGTGDRVADDIPEERNLTEGGEPPSELDSASGGASAIGILSLALPVVAVLLLGGLFLSSNRSPRHTGWYGGISFGVAGVIGLFIGYVIGPVASGSVESAFDSDSSEIEALADGFVSVVDGLFSTIATQAWIMTIVGVAAVGLVYAEENGYIDDLRDSIGSDGQQGQQGQYQQGQGQQGQYQQDQYQQGQGQQDQYQQGQGQQDQYQQDQYQQDQYQQDQGQQSSGESAQSGESDESEGDDQDPQQYDQGGYRSEDEE